ncbi:MAG: hypothetical protein ABSH28_11820 [Acidobacteriota bacterium]
MTIVNLTPHPLTLVSKDGSIQVIPSSGIARVAMVTQLLGCLDGYPLALHEPREVTGLPVPLPGAVYVVSTLVAQAVPTREDVVAPDTGAGAVRNEEGCIVAVRGFARFSPPKLHTRHRRVSSLPIRLGR